MGDVDLRCSTADDDREIYQTWTAVHGEAVGHGGTKADALRNLAAEMDRREMRAERGDL